MVTIRGIDETLDKVILNFKKQIENQIGKEITYIVATKLYAEVIEKNIYVKDVRYENTKRKKNRKIVFEIEMKND